MSKSNTSDSLSVIVQDMTNHPICRSHGPALLFSRGTQEFFACSAVRNQNACPIVFDKVLPTNDELIQAHKSRTDRQILIRQEVILTSLFVCEPYT